MATSTMNTSSCTHQIGETAGLVWATLDELGPMSVSKLAQLIDAPRDVVHQAIGWLAREAKLTIEQQGRARVISLIEQ